MDETTAKYAEKYCTHVEFRTLPKGVPDPPVDVQVELGPQDGTLLVTWLPVTINSQSGKSNGVPVTGYAVYADGRKVTEVDSPTGDVSSWIDWRRWIEWYNNLTNCVYLVSFRRPRLTGHFQLHGIARQARDGADQSQGEPIG